MCRTWPRLGLTVASALPTGLASSPGTRSGRPTHRGTRIFTSPSASGPAPSVTTVTQSKAKRPYSTCDSGSPAALAPARQHVPPSKLTPQINCFGDPRWETDTKLSRNVCFYPGLSPFITDDSDPLGYVFNNPVDGDQTFALTWVTQLL